jgi:hypothetical protein
VVLGGGWGPSELNTMPFNEFLRWYNLAYDTHKEREKNK